MTCGLPFYFRRIQVKSNFLNEVRRLQLIWKKKKGESGRSIHFGHNTLQTSEIQWNKYLHHMVSWRSGLSRPVLTQFHFVVWLFRKVAGSTPAGTFLSVFCFLTIQILGL